MTISRPIRLSFVAVVITACLAVAFKPIETIGTIERIDPALDAIIKKDAQVEIIAEGYDWSEGPVWIPQSNMLLFSDVPKNTIYKWTQKNGAEVYLSPSGYTGTAPSNRKEPGSNGLALRKDGKLVLCQHGDRRVALMDAPLKAPKSTFTTLADNYGGKKLNSPNDVTIKSNGELFFTDPPYGLPTQKEGDPLKEISFQGVYRVSTSGQVTLLTDSITRPNGIAFTPDEKTLVVANSDPAKPIWYAFDVQGGSLTNARIFHDATQASKTEKGLPDGLKFDKQGNLFASGPGGIWIFGKNGKLIGKIKITERVSNCALGDDDKTLYITADMYVLRVKMR